jgi:hypothetical protein
MARNRIAVIGLGMAVTPHAKSLVDLKDRVEVVHAFSPSEARRKAFGEKFPFPLDGSLDCESLPTSPIECVENPHAAEHASRSGAQVRGSRKAHPYGEASRGLDRARRRTRANGAQGRRSRSA